MPFRSLKSILQLITVLAWALWFGGTIAMFVFVPYMFKVFPHAVAGPPANALFHIFGRYELILAAVSLLSTALLLVTYPSKGFVLILATLVMAGGMSVTVTLGLMPLMDSLQNENKQDTTEWKKLHGKSMVALLGQSGMLLLTGIALVLTLDPPQPPAVNLDEEDPEFEPGLPRRAGLSQRV